MRHLIIFACVLLLAACQSTNPQQETADEAAPQEEQVSAVSPETTDTQSEPDWFTFMTAGELTCVSPNGDSFRMRASKSGALWTKYATRQPLTGTFSVLPDGSGWKRTIGYLGTREQPISRDGHVIVIEGELATWRCGR